MRSDSLFPLTTFDLFSGHSLSCLLYPIIPLWLSSMLERFFFFFQAEDGIRDIGVTGVQTCALPIFHHKMFFRPRRDARALFDRRAGGETGGARAGRSQCGAALFRNSESSGQRARPREIGRASCRERV